MDIISNDTFSVDAVKDILTLRSSTTRVTDGSKVSYTDKPSLISLVNTENGLAFAGSPVKQGLFESVSDFDNSDNPVIALVRFNKKKEKEAE